MENGLKTLFALYHWRRGTEDSVSEEELAQAKTEGYLFDYPEYETHSDTLNRIKPLLAQIDPGDVARAFLFSLSTRRLEYRSALGSYYYARAIPAHAFMNSYNETLAAAAIHCYFCGWTAWKTAPGKYDQLYHSYDIFNYERYKYGGLRHTRVDYALFDLEQFLKLPKVIPTEEDRRIFSQILSCVDGLNGSDKAGKLRAAITKARLFKSNQAEVSVLLSELGICGILAGEDAPSYDVYFANEYERSPLEHTNDFPYPINRWHARDGVNAERLREVFGDAFSV